MVPFIQLFSQINGGSEGSGGSGTSCGRQRALKSSLPKYRSISVAKERSPNLNGNRAEDAVAVAVKRSPSSSLEKVDTVVAALPAWKRRLGMERVSPTRGSTERKAWTPTLAKTPKRAIRFNSQHMATGLLEKGGNQQ
jgi:hypothetical protein